MLNDLVSGLNPLYVVECFRSTGKEPQFESFEES